MCEWVERTAFGSIFKVYENKMYLITVIQIVEEKGLVGYVVDEFLYSDAQIRQ